MESNVIIEAKNVTKKFKDFHAVDNVSFDVKKGEIFGLLGPNGAGKSTTLRMLTTLTRPSSGTVKIGGYDVVKDDGKVRELVGLVSEKMITYDRLTAKENLWFFGKLYDIPNDVLNKRIDELLEMVQLSQWKNIVTGTFSTGMRQRMNVIRALLNMPQVLFLDEPTLGLDPQSSVEVREFIRKINKNNGTTIILTTHMMVDADMLCDRIGIMDHGKIVALDTSKNLKKLISGNNHNIFDLDVTNLTNQAVASIKSLKCVTSISQESSTRIKIHTVDEDAFDQIIDTLRINKCKINSISHLEATLEDVFLHLTGRNVRDNADQKPKMEQHGPFKTRNRIR